MLTVLTCAVLIWLAARGEELLVLHPAGARAIALAALLALDACLAGDETPRRSGPCRDCHRDCGVLRDECHARCERAFCQGEEDQMGAGGAGGEP